ncbi:MAG: aminomethyl-transferring glycine dehydrogenase subunit GcvPB [Clostridiaceae bacterium]|nr:aminomethyl-transferring glycine dehydrogenase subunit GcvPB [Clostridiaceae bacterium]
MKLIFEMGAPGRGCDLIPPCTTPEITPKVPLRKKALHLPEVSETELSRHYTDLAKQTHGVNDGFYPLGSCTMKYNPKINDAASLLPGFTNIHPLQDEKNVQGCLEVLSSIEEALCEITGMQACTLQPAAGAHGEFTGLLLIKAWHTSRGDSKRTKIIVPDSAHGTNPASAAMASFDVMHLNLHKTFSTPHGGGGPGSGPVACKDFLAQFLPGLRIGKQTDGTFTEETAAHTIGNVRSFSSNFLVVVRAFCYILTLGREGIPEASTTAVLNANYMMHKLSGHYKMAYDHTCMHEFVMTLEQEKHARNVSALDIAKALLDHGIHPPTMYFPLIVHEALMIEPTETESRETLDEAVQIFLDVLTEAEAHPEKMHEYPLETPVRRLDEVGAARKPVVRYLYDEE